MQKIVSISKEKDGHELKLQLTSSKFLVHLDQFIIHTEPLYHFTVKTQSQDMTLILYDCLVAMVEVISKLLNRLGYCMSLTPSSYYLDLYCKNEPRHFTRKNSEFGISINNSDVQDAADSLSKTDIQNVKELWDQQNERQLQRLLRRFQEFLTSDIVRRCHLIHTSEYSEKFLTSFLRLCDALKMNRIKAADEFSLIQVQMKDPVSLEKLFTERKLNDSPCISHVVEVLLLSLPHNMVVESGFSKMKTVESIHQSRMDAATYDARRIICSHFDRKTFERFQAPQNLMKMISQACSQYKLRQKKKSTIELPQLSSSSKSRVTGVYKRRNTQTVDK